MAPIRAVLLVASIAVVAGLIDGPGIAQAMSAEPAPHAPAPVAGASTASASAPAAAGITTPFDIQTVLDDSFLLLIWLFAGAAVGELIHFIRYQNRPASLKPPHVLRYYVLFGAISGFAALVLAERFGWSTPHWDWILVAVLGGAVGVGELASRYKDEPIKAILSVPATVYVLLNAGAALLALLLGRYFDLWDDTPEDPVSWSQVLAAGLGAMVILRSSVFRIRVGNKQDVEVGPSSFLQSVIDAADRAVDRVRAQERAWTVVSLMEKVPSDKAMVILPSYIPALMQNLRSEDHSTFNGAIKALKEDTDFSEQMKPMILGLYAMNLFGEKVLRAAVESLANGIFKGVEATEQTAKAASSQAKRTRSSAESAQAVAERAGDLVQDERVPSELQEAVHVVVGSIAETKQNAEAAVDSTRKTEISVADTKEILQKTLKAKRS